MLGKRLYKQELQKELAEAMKGATGCDDFDLQNSSSIPSTNVHEPFCYVLSPLGSHSQAKDKKKMKIKSHFTTSPTFTFANATASQPSLTQPTLNTLWKKQLKDVTSQYIAKWW